MMKTNQSNRSIHQSINRSIALHSIYPLLPAANALFPFMSGNSEQPIYFSALSTVQQLLLYCGHFFSGFSTRVYNYNVYDVCIADKVWWVRPEFELKNRSICRPGKMTLASLANVTIELSKHDLTSLGWRCIDSRLRGFPSSDWDTMWHYAVHERPAVYNA